jgi:zinc and cadmium transporter
LNYLTQATVILGGVVGVLVGRQVGSAPTLLLAFAAGGFLYIASSDLIPEIKRETSVERSLLYFGVYLTGLVLMLGVREIRGLLG